MISILTFTLGYPMKPVWPRTFELAARNCTMAAHYRKCSPLVRNSLANPIAAYWSVILIISQRHSSSRKCFTLAFLFCLFSNKFAVQQIFSAYGCHGTLTRENVKNLLFCILVFFKGNGWTCRRSPEHNGKPAALLLNRWKKS